MPGLATTDRVWCSGLAKCARWMVSGAMGRSFLAQGHDDDDVVLAPKGGKIRARAPITVVQG